MPGPLGHLHPIELAAALGAWDNCVPAVDRSRSPAEWSLRYDGETVSFGGAVLTAHTTAGHTKGTTTWTLDEPGVPEVDKGRPLHVVIVGSPNVNPGYKLVNNKTYPEIAADYAHGFQVLKSLPCDIFLGAHGGYFDLKEKYARWKAGARNAFIDPDGYKAYIANRQQAFEAELKRQSESEQ